MRNLTSMQKKLLKLAAIDYEKKHGQLPSCIDDLDYHKVVLPIGNINPCEVFWQNANRFISDLFFERQRSK
jgi:hypothetical protein